MPKIIPVTADKPNAAAQHARVDADAGDAGKAGELRRHDAAERREPPRRDAAPRPAPPANATTRLSVSICWTTRERVAPTARRTDSSFWRLAARASSSVATFAQAISITKPTAPSSTSSAGRTSPTNASRSGRRFGTVIRVLGRVRLRQARADEPQILARLFRRDAVAQPADDVEEVRGAQRAVVIVERQRHDDVRARGPPEMRRQHADDLERRCR